MPDNTYTTIEAPYISGFTPTFGLSGSFVMVTGDYMGDVTGLHFVDAQGEKTSAAFEAKQAADGNYFLSGTVPGIESSKIEKFPKFALEASNSIGTGKLCCYELQKPEGYRVYGDMAISSGLCVEKIDVNLGYDNLLVVGDLQDGCIYKRPMGTIAADLANSSNYADIANLALSVQIGWHQFGEEFETTLRIPEDGTATSGHGLKIASMEVTPARDDSYLLVDADLSVSADSVTEVSAMLFKNDDLYPKKIWKTYIHLKNTAQTLRLRHIEPVDVAAVEQTWSIHVGVGMMRQSKRLRVLVNRVVDQAYKPYESWSTDIYGEKATSVLWCREMKSGALNVLIEGPSF